MLEGQEFQPNRIYAHLDHVQLPGGAEREVDDAVGVEDAAISDRDDDGALVAEVGHLDLTAEGEGAVGSGEFVHVEAPATGGEVSLEDRAIPTGKAALEPDETGVDGWPGEGDGVYDLGGGDVVRHRDHRSCVRRSRGYRWGGFCRESGHDQQGRYSQRGLVPSR